MASNKHRLTITVDPHLVDASHDAVAAGKADSVSAWISDAMEEKLRREQRLGARQARLATALHSTEIHPIDEATGRTIGQLLGAANLADIVDAAVALLADDGDGDGDGDDIITSDHDDLERLCNTLGRHVELIHP